MIEAKASANQMWCHTTVINGFFKEGDVAKAYSIFLKMPDYGISPNVVTYNSVIDGLCKAHEMHMAEEVLQQMVDKSVMPCTTTYNTLINGYCLLGWWKEAIIMLKQMSRDGRGPNVVTYSMLMSIFARMEDVQKLERFLIILLRRDQSPILLPIVLCFMGMLLKELLLN